MADDGLLSQEDIDALTASLGGGDSRSQPTRKSSRETVTQAVEPESIRDSVKVFLEQASTVLGTVLNRQVDLNIRELKMLQFSEIAMSYGSDTLCMKSGFDRGMSGDLFFLVSKNDTALIADLMMMGDGTAPYEDDHRDALTELGNQIMGAVNTAMGARFEVQLGSVQSTASDFDTNSPPFATDTAVQVIISFSINDFPNREIALIISQELALAWASANAEPSAPDFGSLSDSGGGSSSDSVDFGGFGNDVGNSFGGGFGNGGGGGSGKAPPPIRQSSSAYSSNPNIDLLLDIPLEISIELGRTRLSIRKIMELGPGSIIELERMAGEPVDLMVNDKIVAKGEVVVVDEYFGIRILSLVSPEERIKNLR